MLKLHITINPLMQNRSQCFDFEINYTASEPGSKISTWLRQIRRELIDRTWHTIWRRVFTFGTSRANSYYLVYGDLRVYNMIELQRPCTHSGHHRDSGAGGQGRISTARTVRLLDNDSNPADMSNLLMLWRPKRKLGFVYM